MKTISVFDLNFVKSREAMETVEVDLDSVKAVARTEFSELIEPILTHFSTKNPDTRATIYTYACISTNFDTPCYSLMVGVAGQKTLLDKIKSGLARTRGVRLRTGDYIRPAQALKEFHIENGFVWKPLDAAEWFSES